MTSSPNTIRVPASDLEQPTLFSYGPHKVYEIDAGIDPTELPRVSLEGRAKALSNIMDAFSARNKAIGANSSPEAMLSHYGQDAIEVTRGMDKKASYLQSAMQLAANVLIAADYMVKAGASVPEIKSDRERMVQDLDNEYGGTGPANVKKRENLVRKAKEVADPNSRGWPKGVNTYGPTNLVVKLKRHL